MSRKDTDSDHAEYVPPMQSTIASERCWSIRDIRKQQFKSEAIAQRIQECVDLDEIRTCDRKSDFNTEDDETNVDVLRKIEDVGP